MRGIWLTLLVGLRPSLLTGGYVTEGYQTRLTSVRTAPVGFPPKCGSTMAHIGDGMLIVPGAPKSSIPLREIDFLTFTGFNRDAGEAHLYVHMTDFERSSSSVITLGCRSVEQCDELAKTLAIAAGVYLYDNAGEPIEFKRPRR